MALATKRSLTRSALIGLVSGGLLVLCLVGSMIYLVYKTQIYVDGAERARQLRGAAADLLMALQDAETGQRGFLLTTEDAFLKPYSDSMQELTSREAKLEAALAAATFIKVDVDNIRDGVNNKLNELQRTLELAKAGRLDEAIAIVRDGYGQKVMAELRTTMNKTIDASDREVTDQFRNNLELAAWLRIVTVAGAVALFTITIVVVLVIRRYIEEIAQARSELEGLNVGLEERVKERTEDLIQANQEIQRYAYIVTHDLRAPLVNIMGFTSELVDALKAINAYFDNEGGPAKEDQRKNAMVAVREDLPEAISFIRSSTRKMDDLINAILKISRDGRRPLKPESLDLENLIRSSVDSIQHQLLEADGEVNISVSVKRLISDQFSIQQIFGNLFDNAVKYRDPARPLRLSVNAYQKNRMTVMVEVSDNGRGIAAEDHERIFELFRRAGTQNSPGEGIGLAHVRSLIRNMGGDITVKSELGKGTSFVIRLPSDLGQFVRGYGA